MSDWLATLEDHRRALDGKGPDERPAQYIIRHGSMRAGLYRPRGVDDQQPHAQDEVYIVHAGHGEFVNGGERRRFGPGDVIFVRAGVEHRFENFSDDFETWVVFWGPDGGEPD